MVKRNSQIFEYRSAHCFGSDCFEAEGDVAGAYTGGDGLFNSGFNGVRGFVLAKTVAEHHGTGKDLRTGVGDALPSNIGGSAAGGFV